MSAARALLFPFWNFRQHRLRAAWRLFIHFALTLVLILALSSIFALALSFGVDTESTVFTALSICFQSFSILLAGLICFFVVDRRSIAELRVDRGFMRELRTGWLLGAALMSGIFFVACASGNITIHRVGAESIQATAILIATQIMWIGLMLVVGLSEEFLSRGMQLKNLAEGMRPLGTRLSCGLAMLLSSAFFGLLHLSNAHATVGSTLCITAAGLMLATARITTGRLALPIGLHASWNYFQGPVFGFAVSGNDTSGNLLSITTEGPEWFTGGAFGPEAGALGLGAILCGTCLIWAWRHALSQSLRSTACEISRLVRFSPSANRSPRLASSQVNAVNEAES